MIWIFKIQQYRCHLNNFRNATLLERGFFSLLHCGEDTALCVTKRESSETEAVELVKRDDTEELIHNIHRPRLAHTSVTLALYVNLLVAFLHRIYKLTNLATFLDKPYGSVRRSHQCCPASARSDSPGAVSPLSASLPKQCFQAPATYWQFRIINMSIVRLLILCTFCLLLFLVCYSDVGSALHETKNEYSQNHHIAAL